MAWYIIAIEALVVIGITIRMVLKFRAAAWSDDEEGAQGDSSPSAPPHPEVTLPDDEKWD